MIMELRSMLNVYKCELQPTIGILPMVAVWHYPMNEHEQISSVFKLITFEEKHNLNSFKNQKHEIQTTDT